MNIFPDHISGTLPGFNRDIIRKLFPIFLKKSKRIRVP